jgi:hypothetical protein
MSKAIIFMNWQLTIRQVFKPSEAEAGNKEAVFSNLLLPALEQKGVTITLTQADCLENRPFYERPRFHRGSGRILHHCRWTVEIQPSAPSG